MTLAPSLPVVYSLAGVAGTLAARPLELPPSAFVRADSQVPQKTPDDCI